MPTPPQRNLILQAGTIPFRRTKSGMEFCLITSSSGGHWGFPKGIIESGITPEETALQESYEEAGLHGRLVGEPVGSYRYDKWDAELEVTMYLMQVEQVDAAWAESDIRERAWLPADEAVRCLDRPALRQLLTAAVERLE